MKEKESVIVSLFEIFHFSQKYLLEGFVKKEQKITKTQLYIIMVVYRKKNLSMSQIASAIVSSKEQTTRAVAPLVECGILSRHHDEDNRRVVHVELTEKGLELISHIRQHVIDNMKARMETLTSEEIQRFGEAADTMLELLMKMDGPGGHIGSSEKR